MMDASFPFESSWIESTLQIPSESRAKAHYSCFSTDSRKLPGGSIFVAIRGEKMDGHDYIAAAIQAGATAILAEKARIEALNLTQQFPEVRFFLVPDVQHAFRTLAAAWRRQFSIPVVLVAGSNGKTTTKELLSAVLRGRFNSVLKTQGSQNGFLGIPMTLLDLRSHHEAAVIEVGIDEVGAMAQHVPLVHPTHTVLTVIGPEHLEKLNDVATVAREECLAFSETSKLGGKIILNLDDEWIAPQHATYPQATTFTLRSSEKTANLRGEWTVSGESSRLQATWADSSQRPTTLTLSVPLPGKHNAQNLLAAVATAVSIGLHSDEIASGLSKFEGAEGRSQIRTLTTPVSATIICDYYNASPVSMNAAFELLAHTGSATSPRMVCLGDMKELGTDELRFHAELAAPLLKTSVGVVLLHGPRMKSLEQSLKNQGFAGTLRHFEDLGALAAEAKKRLQAGMLVLIKGSRSMKMETVWQELQKP